MNKYQKQLHKQVKNTIADKLNYIIESYSKGNDNLCVFIGSNLLSEFMSDYKNYNKAYKRVKFKLRNNIKINELDVIDGETSRRFYNKNKSKIFEMISNKFDKEFEHKSNTFYDSFTSINSMKLGK